MPKKKDQREKRVKLLDLNQSNALNLKNYKINRNNMHNCLKIKNPNIKKLCDHCKNKFKN